MVYGPATLKTLVKHKHRAAIYYLNQKAQINSRQKIQVSLFIPNNKAQIQQRQFLVNYGIIPKCHKNYPFTQVSLKACLLLQCQEFLKQRKMTL